jgi:hypothetical protein
VQFVGREIRVLDYIEGVGQEIGYYIAELRTRKYHQALLVLPHDGDAHHGPIDKTYRSMFIDSGFEVEVIPNEGPGAVSNASRQLGGPSRAPGGMLIRLRLDARRLASITRKKTRRAISGWGRSTTGLRMRAMRLA